MQRPLVPDVSPYHRIHCIDGEDPQNHSDPDVLRKNVDENQYESENEQQDTYHRQIEAPLGQTETTDVTCAPDHPPVKRVHQGNDKKNDKHC